MGKFDTCLLFILILLSLSAGLFGQNLKADCPNVIYIYADDLGYGDLSCYGASKISTSHVDRLPKEGLRFTR